MPRRAPSPIRVGKCTPWPFPPRPGERRRRSMCKWVCARTPRGAEFASRRGVPQTAVLHPSTKKVGQWQVSFFDADGAIRDVIRPTCNQALADADIVTDLWKLKAAQ